MSRITQSLDDSYSTGLWKLPFTCAEEHFQVNRVFLEIILTFCLLGSLNKLSWHTGETISIVLSKVDSTCPKEHFESKRLFLSNSLYSFKSFRPSKQLFGGLRNFFGLLSTLFVGLSKLLPLVRRDILKKRSFCKTFVLSRSFSDV